MTRYFFHLHNDINTPDNQGADYPDDRSAMEEALRSARDLASHNVKEGKLDLSHFIICVDETGREVGIVYFADAVSVVGASGRN